MAATRAAVDRMMDELLDPNVPAEQAAAIVSELWRGRPVPDGVAFFVAAKSSPERAAAVAQATLELLPGDLAALTLAAGVAAVRGDVDAAICSYEAALGAGNDPEVRRRYAFALLTAGRIRATLEALEELLRKDPGDFEAQEAYGEALSQAHTHAEELGPSAACPCGSPEAFGACCLPAERAALERFADRDPFYELREVVLDYSFRPEHEDLRWAARLAWFGDDPDAEIGEAEIDEGHLRLFMEWAWGAPNVDDVEGDLDADDDEEDDCI
ncbi:MAG: tetratricopeptide repeat protein, partial [Actinomycetota bacterium]